MVVGCSPQPEIDVDAERNALMSADRAWFEAYSGSDSPADAFIEQLVDNASLLPPDAPLAQGKEAIRVVIMELEAMPGFSITWGPDAADVGSGGDLGFTVGSYEMKMDGPEGPMRIDGKYITVWRKQLDGTWRVTADMFNANGPPTPQM
jgi:ketosteroid isomerase-like protein